MLRPLTAALLLLLMITLPACQTQPTCACTECPAMSESVYRHVVAFKFKDGTSDAQVQAILDGFAALPEQIDTITGYEFGENVSPEDHAQGFTHCFIVTFADQAGLETYLPHPAHTAFVEQLLPHLDKVFVVDYYAQ